MQHKRDLTCKKCLENNLSDFWYCFQCYAEGRVARFYTGKVKLVKVTGSGGYPVTEPCINPPVVVPHSVLGENSKILHYSRSATQL